MGAEIAGFSAEPWWEGYHRTDDHMLCGLLLHRMLVVKFLVSQYSVSWIVNKNIKLHLRDDIKMRKEKKELERPVGIH
jgi:hypothetical protein